MVYGILRLQGNISMLEADKLPRCNHPQDACHFVHMKKTLLIAIVACCLLPASHTVHAQNGYDNSYHEFGLTYGKMGNAKMTELMGDVAGATTDMTLTNEVYGGTYGVDYFHRAVEDWFCLGLMLCYGQSTMDFSTADDGAVEGHLDHRYYSVMPAVKFDWLRTPIFGMYSRLALGVDLRHWQKEYVDGRPSEEGLSPCFTFQVSLLGIELGLPRLRLFAEGGLGELGTLSGGLRFKF